MLVIPGINAETGLRNAYYNYYYEVDVLLLVVAKPTLIGMANK